jgi:hypothetical protein
LIINADNCRGFIVEEESNMSSNTSIGRGKKGSKFWMQQLVNGRDVTQLNEAIYGKECKIEWISPLANEDYSEYMLNSETLQETLRGKGVVFEKSFFNFWPARQPQWDAIGITEDKTLNLVEAKAHTSETITHKQTDEEKMSDGSKRNLKLITESMRESFESLNSKGDFDAWLNEYYQLGNRLTFMTKLRGKGIKVKLVLLNIVGDPTHISTTENEWKNHYAQAFEKMLGSSDTPQDVITVNFKV